MVLPLALLVLSGGFAQAQTGAQTGACCSSAGLCRQLGLMPGGQGDYYQRLEAALSDLNQLQTRFRQVQDRRNELTRQLEGESPTFGLTGSASGDPVDGQIATYQALTELNGH